MRFLKAVKEALILTGIVLLFTTLIIVGISVVFYLLQPLVGNFFAGIITLVVMTFLITLAIALGS